MADDADIAQAQDETLLQSRVEAARRTVAHIPGPYLCKRCDDVNDRRVDGWATCSACDAEMYTPGD